MTEKKIIKKTSVKKSDTKKTVAKTSAKTTDTKKSVAKTTKSTKTGKTAKSKAKSTKSTSKKSVDELMGDGGIVIVDDDITVDQEKINEERRAYLEEARSQEAVD